MEARDAEALAQLVEEQAALRRVATLVAEDAEPADIFAAVTTEVEHLFGFEPGTRDVTGVVRFDPGPELLVVGVSKTLEAVPLGARFEVSDLFAPTRVLHTGTSARIDESDLLAAGGDVADFLRHEGYLSQVASPIVVRGRLWGAISANSGTALPADAEERLEKFTELVATAIANAESRDALARLAGEQAALRRVATLVAGGATPADVFAGAAREVAELFGVPAISMVRLEDAGRSIEIGSWGEENPFPVGTRFDPHPGVVELIRQTGRPARIEAYSELPGAVAAEMVASGVRSAIGAPIFVDGRMWGALAALCVASQPPGAEDRLASFTELLSTAIANTDARDHVGRLLDEQAALRRVATLIARDAPSVDVLDAVATEVGTLFATDITVVGRYDDDGFATSIGNWSASGGGVPLGTRSAVGGHNVLSLVAETGKPARIDGYDDASGEAAEIARKYGWRSSIAAPILVEDRVWGVMLVATQQPESFPAGSEERLAAFTDLVATAIANTKSRAEVERLADEQAALRRVATLVAKEDLPEEVFALVAEETGRLFGGVECTLLRTDPDGLVTNVGCWGESIAGVFPTGTRFAPDPGGDGVAAVVLRTGRSYRIDNYDAVVDPVARGALDRGIESAVGCPIVVRGAVWGAIMVTGAERFPPDTEVRLSQFADLVATAVANAEARIEIVQLADEQAAQRRVATLVAYGAAPVEIFSAVTTEVGRLFATDLAIVGRLETAPPSLVAVAVGPGVEGVEVGSAWTLDDPEAASEVFRSRRAVRGNERLRQRSAALADTFERLGVVSMVASPIVVDGGFWGVVIVPSRTELEADTEDRLQKFTDLVGIAIANADGKSKLAASRRRIVTASDETRRQIERNLHDGTQQRLVSLGLAVRAAEANLPPDRQDLRDELSRVALGLADAVEDLQEISRGIHPAILSKGGVGAALRSLASVSPIAVDLDVDFDARLAEPVEVAAYYVASEALANAAKHSGATRIDVSLEQRDGRIVLSIRDDGVGGADPALGSGLVGLTDRVEALGGSITVESRRGEGTQIEAQLPAELEASTSKG